VEPTLNHYEQLFRPVDINDLSAGREFKAAGLIALRVKMNETIPDPDSRSDNIAERKLNMADEDLDSGLKKSMERLLFDSPLLKSMHDLMEVAKLIKVEPVEDSLIKSSPFISTKKISRPVIKSSADAKPLRRPMLQVYQCRCLTCSTTTKGKPRKYPRVFPNKRAMKSHIMEMRARVCLDIANHFIFSPENERRNPRPKKDESSVSRIKRLKNRSVDERAPKRSGGISGDLELPKGITYQPRPRSKEGENPVFVVSARLPVCPGSKKKRTVQKMITIQPGDNVQSRLQEAKELRLHMTSNPNEYMKSQAKKIAKRSVRRKKAATAGVRVKIPGVRKM
jgi:hypothetical protein